jgi:hypothetical protein
LSRLREAPIGGASPAPEKDQEMLSLASAVTLLLFAFVVSQPFFYLLALDRASNALAGPAYVALRQQINAAIEKPLIRLYVITLLAAIALSVLAFVQGARGLALGSGIAAICLAVDAVLAVKRNVPINTIMNAWSTSDLPEEWATYRAHWNAAFTARKVVLAAGFLALVAGLVAP